LILAFEWVPGCGGDGANTYDVGGSSTRKKFGVPLRFWVAFSAFKDEGNQVLAGIRNEKECRKTVKDRSEWPGQTV
jgi:hypothetical protein